MVPAAQQHQVGQVGPTAGFPREDVVDDGKGDVGTAREPTVAVPADDLASLGARGEAPGPALVHGVAQRVVDGNDDGGVTGDALHRLDVDQTVMLELPCQLTLLA